jgi:hypothetical protein
MTMNADPERLRILEEFRRVSRELGRPPSRSEFKSHTGLSEYRILAHFPSYREAVRAAGLQPDSTNVRLQDVLLFEDYGSVVRKLHQVPTRVQYRREGNYSAGVFDKHFGPWSVMPAKFREWAGDRPEWADVIAILPTDYLAPITNSARSTLKDPIVKINNERTYIEHSKLDGSPTLWEPNRFSRTASRARQ